MSVTVQVCIQTDVGLQELTATLLSLSGYEPLRPPCEIEDGIEFWTKTNVALLVCHNDFVNDRDCDFENYSRVVLIQAYRNDPKERVEMCLDVGRAVFSHLIESYDAPTLMTFNVQRVLDRHIPRYPAGAVEGGRGQI